ncbi:MAG TPA: FtsX-like permease family protein [Anaerolineales bacterium]|nr:FtsX-like permease family protein [Anaerolineales bacterium]HND48717.1 FtsX-like permease family protein [Anaerolineales bacterium]
MNLYLRLAWRNIWRHRRRTVIIVLAMGFALAMMMMYDGLVDGFNNAIYGNAIRVLGGNIQVRAEGYREKVDSTPLIPLPNDEEALKAALAHPDVTAAFRRIQTGGLLSNREGAFPLSIVGIEPEAEAPVSLVAENVVDGRWLTGADEDVVLIGRGLADVMDLQVGDRITMVGSDAHKQNRQRTMTVVGIYDLGMPSIEKQTVYISLAEAQSLFDLRDQSTEVQINLKDLGNEAVVVNALAPTLPGYEVSTWAENYPEFSTAITSKNFVMDIFSVIIQAIAGIGVLNLLLMAVFERTREIGLLGAMGLKPRQIATLFILEGTLIGVVGVVAGILFGIAFNASFAQVGFDYSSFAGVADYMALISGRVYPSLGLGKIVWRSITVLVITTLAAWIPAREAALREPAQALHYV